MSSSSSTLRPWAIHPVYYVGMGLYTLVLAAVLFRIFRHCRKHGASAAATDGSSSSLASYFTWSLPILLCARLVWWVFLLFRVLDEAAMFVNRICMCLFLISFGLLLFLWTDTSMTTVNPLFARAAVHGDLDYGFMSPGAKLAFWAVTVTVCGLTLGTILAGTLFSGGHRPKENSVLYQMNIVILSVTFALYAVAYAWSGFKLWRRLVHNSSLSRLGLFRVISFAVVLTVCYLVRAWFMSMWIITGVKIERTAFFSLAYIVPELVPIACYLWISASPFEVDVSSTATAHQPLLSPSTSATIPVYSETTGSPASSPRRPNPLPFVSTSDSDH